MITATITTDINIGPFRIPSNGQNMIMNNYAERNNLVVELVIPEPLNFGQAIIFNPFVLHGNIAFNSKFARVAYSVRFQSSNKPLLQKNTDYLKYYRLN